MKKITQQLSLAKQMYLIATVSILLLAIMSIYTLRLTGWAQLYEILMVGIASAAALFWLAHYLGNQSAKRALSIVEALKSMAEGELGKIPRLPGKDEFSWMAWEYGRACKQITSVIRDIQNHASELAAAADELATIAVHSRQQIQYQNDQIGQLSSAMTEMATTIQSVTKEIAETAAAATETDQLAQEGQRDFENTLGSITALTVRTEEIATVIDRLKNDSIAIGSVLEVIQGIAEQTNLLALNAAIEAARAGEQGRGFAVVAEEVRTLASRTQQSTREIQDMITRLQLAATDAVEAIEGGKADVEASRRQAGQAGATLEEILRAVDRISQRSTQIAAAAEQQSVTAEEINDNVVTIHDISRSAASGAEQIAGSGDQLAQLAELLQNLANRFSLAKD